ncbi:MAG: LysR family transcriptional regulator [Myxococcota bacterium]
MHPRPLSQIDLNLLVYLEHLLRERSVTRAAARAGITQSAMSRALSRLREHLDDRLLVPVGRSMQLTDHAKSLEAPLHDVLSQLRNTIFAPQQFDPASAEREFSIAGPDFVDSLLTGPLVIRLAEQAPGIDLHLAGMGPAVAGDILKGRLDLMIGFVPGNHSSLHARRVLTDRFVCVVRRRHPALQRKKIRLEAYTAYPHVLVSPGGRPGSFVDRALRERDASRRVAVRVHSFLLAPDYILDTNYILTVPEKVAARITETYDVAVVPLPLPVPGFTLSMVWHARNQRDQGHVWMRTQILEIAESLN